MARYIISTNKLIRRYCGNYQRQARLFVTEANNNDRTTANVVLIGAGWWSQVSAFFILTCKDVVGFNMYRMLINGLCFCEYRYALNCILYV